MNPLNIHHHKAHGNICTIEELQKYLPLTAREKKTMEQVIVDHPFLISKYYLSLIDPKDKKDPIRKMMIPSGEEVGIEGEWDTSGEQCNTKLTGLQHKYKQTAFILATNRCAAYCRYCFRKRMVGLSSKEVLRMFDKAVAYIRVHKEINNVLISGGDPFMLPASVIEQFLKKLTVIPHLDFIRFGTRMPVTYPQRITEGKKLMQVLKRYSKKEKPIYIVTHFNHPREITPQSEKALTMLQEAGIGIYNQTVLLHGVNDNPDLLVDLWTRLLKMGVMPYYFFQCRPVRKVKTHFQVPLYRGIQIFNKARNNVGGHIMCKRFKYVMSHETGKIEILGVEKGRIFFKYHHAKDFRNAGKLFSRKLDTTAGWLDDLKV